MPPVMTIGQLDDLYAQLAQVSGMREREWRDILSLSPAAAEQAVKDWQALGKLSWAREQSVADEVLSVLTTLAQWATPLGIIAGTVTGVAGAITAIKGA
jgi:hypothetical protein